MFPVILQWGSFTLYSYGLFVATAFLAGIFWATRRARRAGLPPYSFFEIGVYGGLACMVGARLLFVLLNWPYFSGRPGEIFRLWDGGLILYGGYVAALLFTLFFLRLLRLPLWKSFDVYAPSLALGLAIGRLGCFFNGCCYGWVSSSWGISFPSAHQPPVFLQQVRDGLISSLSLHTLPVIPTQVLSAGGDLVIMTVLLLLDRKPRFPGFLFWTFVLLYSLGRGAIEFIRFQEKVEVFHLFFPFSLSQGISLALAVFSAIVLLSLHRGSKKGV